MKTLIIVDREERLVLAGYYGDCISVGTWLDCKITQLIYERIDSERPWSASLHDMGGDGGQGDVEG